MCGINGFNFKNKKLIKQMNKTITHRGPDDSGIFMDENVSLGHVRLSIIDLSKKGKQPMKYKKDGKEAFIVFNGEIYNFLKIREELKKKGYRFKSKTDTEVILASYFEWGFDAVKKFNGMWAFAIYDVDEKILFLSRDRLGVKPLYYFFDGKNFIFSSEPRGIYVHNINKRDNINKRAVSLYFSLGFIPHPYSIFKNMYKLEPSTNLIFGLKNKKIKKHRYWDIPVYKPIHDINKLKNEFFSIFEDAIKLRLISDVEIGVLLSGGLDSGSIYYMLNKKIKQKLKSFSIGFKEKNLDETENVKTITKTIGKYKHIHKYFENKKFLEIENEIIEMLDEPFSDFSIFPSYFLYKTVSQDVKAAISGDGGDEIFGGYRHYSNVKKIEKLSKLPFFVLNFVNRLIQFERINKIIKMSIDLKKGKNYFYYITNDKLVTREYEKFLKEKFSSIKKYTNDIGEMYRIYDIKYGTLPENYLHKVDKSSMFTSLEIRSPFLDYRFVEFSQKIPIYLKFNISQTKIFIRKTMKNLLPEKIIRGKKMGFTPPHWIWEKKYEKKLKNMLDELYKEKIITKEIYDFFVNKSLKRRYKTSSIYNGRLIFFYKWYKRWVN